MGDISLNRNLGSQTFSVQLTSATDGSDVTSGSPTVQVSKDGAAYGAITGSIAHGANGSWIVSPSAADTDFDRGSYSVSLAGAISVTLNANTTWGDIKTVSGAVGEVTGNVGGSVASVTGSVGSVTGSVSSVTSPVTTDSASNIAIGNQVLSTSVSESYSSASGTPILSQILHEINQTVADFSVSGTTLTVRNRAGSTAMTFTLDDASNPTDRTRTT